MTIEETRAFLREHDEYLILTHIRPDGDTIGCAAALCMALRKMNKTAYVLYNDGITKTYEQYIAPFYSPEGYTATTVVSVDVADSNMLFPAAEVYSASIDLCIDHHASNSFYAKNTCVDGSMASCGEYLYDILAPMVDIDEAMAIVLYIAVSTDTGCFVYANTTSHTHTTAAKLMEYGDFAPGINKKCFRTKSAKRLKIEAMLMNDARLYQDGKIVIGAVTLAMMDSINATEVDVEDISGYLGAIEGVICSVTIREQTPTRCKISVRTGHELNSSDICAVYGGGGHHGAAGVTLEMPLDQAIEAIYSAICKVQGM